MAKKVVILGSVIKQQAFTRQMIEKHLVLEDADPAVFYGVGNANMQLLKALFPKVRIVARGNVLRIMGEDSETARFEQAVLRIEKYCSQFNSLTEENVVDLVNGQDPQGEKTSDVILFGISGRPISPRTGNQKKLVSDYTNHDMLLAVGPAGSGKTYTAIALAVRALKNKEVKRIVLCRPAVEAGEKLGFLPGDMREKIDPYLQPLYDALQDMIPGAKLKELMDMGTIQIAPLAFMRGRTLNDAVVILDEAQNTTPQQIKMFLTRMGWNTKMIVTGDLTQIDLPPTQISGLVQALEVLKDIEGVSIIRMTKKDIVRHKLVTRIVEAYDRYDETHKETERKPYKSKSNEQSIDRN